MFERDDIHIDPDFELHFGRDEMFNSFPVVIGTVGFRLVDTAKLNELADKVRMQLGHKPACGFTDDDDIDFDVWYDFFYDINSCSGMDAQIVCEVIHGNCSYTEDADDVIVIDIPPEARRQIRPWLDEELRKIYGESIRELLIQAEKEALV